MEKYPEGAFCPLHINLYYAPLTDLFWRKFEEELQEEVKYIKNYANELVGLGKEYDISYSE